MKKLFNKFKIYDVASFWMLVKQFIKFGVVGVSNTLVHFVIYYGLVFLGVHYLVSNTLGFAISVLNAYYWNNKYVFKTEKGNTIRKLAKVYASYGFTFLLSTGLLFLIVDVIGISYMIAPLITMIITIPTNFILNKFWAFRQR
ncbi:MAG: GtrA family protein [Oscillospiraceae bacterium]|nr:GtrA family protein [Oscillospiraceae bacterium]